ncbi:MAG: hypothetical protein ACJ71G_03945 [Nitrososphaeraceae archaeon]
MTKKIVGLEATMQESRMVGRLQNKAFWIWNIKSISKKISKQMYTATLIISLAYLRT